MKNSTFFQVACLILTSFSASIYAGQKDGEWTIVGSYEIPGKASGLAWDGTYLYFGIYGAQGENVYQFDPSNNTYQLKFSNPAIGDSYGMTFDGTNLWIIDRVGNPAYALELDLDGNIMSQFNLPDQYMSGIAWDDGEFWVSTYYPDPGIVYKVDGTGNVLHQFAPPHDQPWDLSLDGDNLWIVDYNAYTIHKIDQDGNILETHDAEDQRPAGIVFDGTYLWYVDGPLGSNSTLYKVDPNGTGTPEIQLAQTTFDYGQVTVNTTEEILFEVGNSGTATLSFYFEVPVGPGLYISDETFEVEPGETAEISALWTPMLAGPLIATVSLFSNDPLHPLTSLNFTGFGLESGPFIYYPWSTHNYGNIRSGSSKRWTMTLQNYGDAALTLESIAIDNTSFYLSDHTPLPINLAPLGMISFDVWFFPQIDDAYEATLSIMSNNPDQSPYEIELVGEATEGEYPIGEQVWSYHLITGWDNSPKAIEYIQDISGDGIEDVIVCSEDDYIRAFNGNASGTSQVLWEREIYSGSVYQQNALSITGDINEDGYDDIIVGTAWGDRSIVALSGKTGEQLWKHQTNNYGGGGWVYQTDTRFDYNNDGFPDVLAATGNDGDNTGPRRVYCLDGKTGTPIWESFINSAAFAVMGMPDINGDDIPDAVAGATSPGDTPGRVIAINGANGQPIWSYNTSGTAVFALEMLDDINEDGIPDIIAGSFNGNYYLLDAANGQPINQGYLGNNLILQFFRLDDINGDGYVDIMPTKSGNSFMVIDGYSGDFVWSKTMADQPWVASPIPDITGNGLHDIAVGTLYQSNFVYFLKGEDGTELFSTPFGEAVDALNVMPDITGDNSWEMIAGGREGKLVSFSGGLDTPVNLPEYKPRSLSFNGTAYPNPTKGQTSIHFNLPHQGELQLRIYDLNGSIVWQNAVKKYPKGENNISWNGKDHAGKDLTQGVYIYELRFEDAYARGRIVLLD
jgi:hypothetical protein